nr:lysozyme inhibitor LprI family protein [Flavobacterium sandaracinum]
MNQKAYKDYEKADKELNTVYQQILKDYKRDSKFILKLKEVQKAWIKFRDAEMNALFPEENKQLEYGSMFPLCWSIELTKLTKERTKKLKVWLNGIEEGDGCAGSIKNKN